MEFRILRAVGLGISAWFRNFIPFTLLAAILYAPAIIYVAAYDLTVVRGEEDFINGFIMTPMYATLGLSALLSPLLTYRVIQQLSGKKVSMLTSVGFGVRGIVPAIILAVVGALIQLVPAGGIGHAIINCIWFVAAPAAVAERLGPLAAFSRSSDLTRGRRWGIFGVNLLITLAVVAVLLLFVVPAYERGELPFGVRGIGYTIVGVVAVLQTFTGIVQAVTYALLRYDKDGVSHEELARVFE